MPYRFKILLEDFCNKYDVFDVRLSKVRNVLLGWNECEDIARRIRKAEARNWGKRNPPL